MKIRTDVAELLRAGHSDRAIAEQLHVCAKTVAAVRTTLGLPKVRSGYKGADFTEAFYMRTKTVDGGHLLWTGYSNNTGAPCFRHGKRLHTACRAAFVIRHGREPIGKAMPGCGLPGCVAPDHVEDRPMRERTRATYAAIFGGTR